VQLEGNTPSRIAAGAEISQNEHALLAVWVEGPVPQSDGSSQAVLYLVGQRRGRALLEVVRVPGGAGPDLDRTLALKVRVAVDEIERARAASPGGTMLAPSQPAARDLSGSEPAWGASLGVGLLGGPQAGAAAGQWGAHLHAGPGLLLDPMRFSLELALAWFPSVHIERAGDSVQLREIAPGLALHAQLRQGAVWLGLRGGMSVAWVQASGLSRTGLTGRARERLTACEGGIDVELPIASGLGVEFALLAQAWLDRQRFAVSGEQVADLGRFRPLLRLSLTWAAPASP
jgi:hypothetical protein